MTYLLKTRVSDFALNLLVASIYIALAKIGLLFALKNPTITIFWPAGGFALAVLLIGGMKYLPGIFIGGVFAGFMAINNPWVAIVLGIADGVESYVACWLASRYLHINIALESRNDFWKLTLSAGVIASVISALIGPTALLIENIIPSSLYPQILLRWWMGDVLGIAFLTPLILIWYKPPPRINNKLQMLEVIAVLGLSTALGIIFFFELLRGSKYEPQGIAWIIILIAWSAFRFGRHFTTVLQLIFFMTALWSAGHHVGRYANDMVQSGLFNFWMFGMVSAIGGLTIAVISDENKKVQNALAKTLNYQYSLLDNFPFMVWLKDTESHFLAVNSAFAHTFGFTDADKLIGKSDFDIAPQEMADNYRADDRNVMESLQQKYVEEEVPTENGRKWMETYKAPVTSADGSVLGTVGFARDITHQRLIAKQIQESEERLRLALLAGNQGWFDLNVQTGEIAVSPEYVHMIGYDPNNFHTDFNEWKNSIHPDDIDAVVTAFKECLATNSQKAMQYRRITAKGSWKWIYSVGKVTEWDVDNHPLRMIGTHTDITSQKNTEIELLIAKSKAEKANNAKSRFLAAASHDLRQPLNALSLYVEMLIRQAPTDDNGLGNKIQSCVNSLSELLNDMLDVSKLDAGVVTPNLTDVPINDLLQSMITIHSPEAELKGLHLRVRPSTEIVRIDPQLMQRIVGNLVFNAIRYTNKGGILIGCRRHQGKLWIEVWDTGIGIHKGELDYIFGEFTQLGDGARNRGSGLGLAIVDKTAKLLGLQVRVRSLLGQGSMFAIEVPLGYAMPTELLTVIKQPSTRLTIAFVDDNLVVLEALSLNLNAFGHVVISATSGRGLFKLLGSSKPDILITDYRLADGETGLDLILAARRLFTDNLPAILITGDTDPELLQAMAKQDITVCHKPLKMSALDIIIRETVERNINT